MRAGVYWQFLSNACIFGGLRKCMGLLFLISEQKVLLFILLTAFVWFFSVSSHCRLVLQACLLEFVVLWPGWVGSFFFFLRYVRIEVSGIDA